MKRRKLTAKFKTKVVLEALKERLSNQELAQKFLGFLISEEAQTILPVTNWMRPVRDGIKLPDVFAGLIQPERIGFTPSEVAENRKEWIKEWRSSAAK